MNCIIIDPILDQIDDITRTYCPAVYFDVRNKEYCVYSLHAGFTGRVKYLADLLLSECGIKLVHKNSFINDGFWISMCCLNGISIDDLWMNLPKAYHSPHTSYVDARILAKAVPKRPRCFMCDKRISRYSCWNYSEISVCKKGYLCSASCRDGYYEALIIHRKMQEKEIEQWRKARKKLLEARKLVKNLLHGPLLSQGTE